MRDGVELFAGEGAQVHARWEVLAQAVSCCVKTHPTAPARCDATKLEAAEILFAGRVAMALARPDLPEWKRVCMVWGASDDIFPPADAHYLDRTFPHSQGIRFVPGAKLFFPEEFPEIIAEEAQRLWRVA